MNQTVANPSLTADASTAPQGRASTLTRLLLSNEFGLAVLLLLTFLIFANTLQGFSSTFSLFTIGRQIGINTMIGLAMMAVIVTGGLDLSVGAIGACTAMVFGYLAQALGVPLVFAIPLAIVFGAGLGFINGFTVVKSGVHSFIITLASMSIFFGLMIFLTKAQSFNLLATGSAKLWKMENWRCAVALTCDFSGHVCGFELVLSLHNIGPLHACCRCQSQSG